MPFHQWRAPKYEARYKQISRKQYKSLAECSFECPGVLVRVSDEKGKKDMTETLTIQVNQSDFCHEEVKQGTLLTFALFYQWVKKAEKLRMTKGTDC